MPKVVQVMRATSGLLALGDDGSLWFGSDELGTRWTPVNLPSHFSPSAPPEQPKGEALGPAWASGLPHDVCLCNEGDQTFHAHYTDNKKCARCKCAMFRRANPQPSTPAQAATCPACGNPSTKMLCWSCFTAEQERAAANITKNATAQAATGKGAP